jgi:hypothetical protein
MTKPLKASFSIVFLLAIAVGVYDRWLLMKAPTARVAASPSPARSFDVDLVKNGALPEYKTTTVSKAFERTFQSQEWKSAVNLQGQSVVMFHGTVKYTVLKEAGFYIGTWNGVAQGIETEKQISEHRHLCSVETGQLETSTPDDETIRPCMAKAYQSMVIPVSFEFTLSPDKKSIEMTLPDPVFQIFDSDHRLRKDRNATLAFIYQ